MLKAKFKTKHIDKGFKDVRKTIEQMKDTAYIKVGILEEDGGKIPEGSDLTLAGIASTLEFGTKKAGRNKNVVIPPRPFIRTTMEEKKDFFSQLTYNALVRITSLKSDPIMELNRIGLAIASAIQAKITNGPWVANARSTKKRKGSSRPLIDTGRMRASIRHAVVKKGDEK